MGFLTKILSTYASGKYFKK